MNASAFPLNENRIRLYNPFTRQGLQQRGMSKLKQIVISLVAVMLAAGIFAGMVLYSIAVIRTAQMKILTGEFDLIALQSAK